MSKKKMIERIKKLQANPPYDTMLRSTNPSTVTAGENATIGWKGALDVVLLILEFEPEDNNLEFELNQ